MGGGWVEGGGDGLTWWQPSEILRKPERIAKLVKREGESERKREHLKSEYIRFA